jgi:hypothetical protein
MGTLFVKVVLWMFKKSKTKKNSKEMIKSLPNPDLKSEYLFSDLELNEQLLKELFQNCSDIVFRAIQENNKTKILLIYIDGLIDTKSLEADVIKPILYDGLPNGITKVRSFVEVVEQKQLAISQVSHVEKVQDLVDGILKANVGILVDGEAKAILASLQGYEKRGVEEPQTEVTIRGPRDGFTESLRTNTALLRRRVRSSRLKMETFSVGELSQTDLVITYIDGIAPTGIIEELRDRISRIQIDGLLGSEFLEEFIEDAPYSPFPQIQNTERPDILIGNLLEGRVAIIVDNSPFALIIPMTFWSGFHAVEDYYERFMYTTFIRFIRLNLILISLYLPSIYVALTTYHPKLIPTTLLISIAAAREGVPFPALIEAVIMEFMFEGLREAGIRLPKAVGSAVSIVGALVIGQAAVQAGIVSAPMVIVVATTGIASFAIPRYNFGLAFRMLRFIMLILAGCFGLYGIIIGFIALTIHLVNLRSYGVSYFTPVSPLNYQELKDTIIRAPRWSLHTRPTFISEGDKTRIPKGQKPRPPKGEPRE